MVLRLVLEAGVLTIAALLQTAAGVVEMIGLMFEHRGTHYDDH